MQQQKDDNINKKLEYAENYLNCHNYSEEQRKDFKHKISILKMEIKRRWIASHYKENIFLKNNEIWLQGILQYPIPTATTRLGRPLKSFIESSERSKRRKTQEIRTTFDTEELTFATQMKLRAEGKTDASNIIKDMSKSPNRATKYRKAYLSNPQVQISQLTPLQALSMFVEAGLSRRQYEIIRNCNKKLYPCYTLLQKAKKDCYSKVESYRVTATCAEINLQDLLDHTVTRLLLYLQEVIEILSEKDRSTLTLTCKWGCDGSQQAQYKQKFENDLESDANIFQSSFVPLQLTCGTDNKITIWQNPTPSSPRYCRPIRIRFIKESTDIINEEIQYIENKINSLQETTVTMANKNFSIKHIMTLTLMEKYAMLSLTTNPP